MFLNRLTRFLILVNIIPVQIRNKVNFEFSICSWRTLLNLFFCFGTSLCIFGFSLTQIFFFIDEIEFLSFSVFALIEFIIYPSVPTIIGHSLSQVEYPLQEIRNKTSKKYFMSGFSFLCFSLASVLRAFNINYLETYNLAKFGFEVMWHSSPCVYLSISSFCLTS